MIISEENVGKRIDKYLSENLDYSRTIIQKMIDNENIKVNDKKTKASYKLELNDTVLIDDNFKEETDILPENIKLDIVYEDNDLMIINKPSGMVVHPGNGNQEHTLVNALMGYTTNLSDGSKTRPGIVHRIDKDTSGLLAIAKNDLAHTVLASQLKDHSMARTYEAIVCGSFREDRGTVDAPIGRHPTDRKKMCVTQRNSKPAVTHWEVVERFRGYTHIRCRLETGRTHQIRVHMAYIGHPILGDTVYGHKKPELGQSSQCLHAGALCFRHPRDGRPILVFAPLPDYFQQVLEKLRKM